MTENLELREWIAVNVMGNKGREVARAIGPSGGVAMSQGTVSPTRRDIEQHCAMYPTFKLEIRREFPPYELTWNDAALVVEAMRARGTFIEIAAIGWGYAISWMRFSGPAVAEPPLPEVTGAGAQKARSLAEAPLAICLAAKAAIEATK